MALIINGESISDTVLEEEFDALKEHHQSLGEVVCCDRDVEFRGRARDNVLNRTLLKQESLRRYGKPTKTEVSKSLTQLKKDHGGDEAFYKNVGMRPEQDDLIREKIATTLSVEKILREQVGNDPEPTEKELRQFYKDNIDDYQTSEEVRTWHIYLEPHSQDEADLYYTLLRKTRAELQGGADFEKTCQAVCREDHQMDLGFYKQGALNREVEIITFSMEVGEISPVVATHFGYHIFKVVDRKARKPIPFKKVQESIAERFQTEYREKKIQDLLDELKSKAKIEETEEEHALA